MMAPMKLRGACVRIEWRMAGYDWPTFRVLEADKHGWLLLQGVADGTIPHDGDVFWAHSSECASIKPIGKRR